MRKKVVIQDSVIHNPDGTESLNPTPMFDRSIPRSPTMQERVRATIRNELSLRAAQEGKETFEESLDFDVDDGFDVEDPITPYEQVQMTEEFLYEDLQKPETEASGRESALAPSEDADPASSSDEASVKANNSSADDSTNVKR